MMLAENSSSPTRYTMVDRFPGKMAGLEIPKHLAQGLFDASHGNGDAARSGRLSGGEQPNTPGRFSIVSDELIVIVRMIENAAENG